jgi:S-formylglutathione hydrolase FrmB
MVDSEDPTGHALELARSATPAMARRRTALAAVVRPAAEVAGLLLVEVLGSPRARAAALGLARSLAGWLAARRLPASAGVEVTTRQVTVVKHADTSVLVHRVETALVVRTLGVARGWPADDEQRPGSKGQQR